MILLTRETYTKPRFSCRERAANWLSLEERQPISGRHGKEGVWPPRFLGFDEISHSLAMKAFPLREGATCHIPLPLTRSSFRVSGEQHGGGGLGTLTKAVQRVLGGGDAHTVDIVSVYGRPDPSPVVVSSSPPTPPSAAPAPSARWRRTPATAPYACVWVSVRMADDSFMDPVKLQGVLALHIQQVSRS